MRRKSTLFLRLRWGYRKQSLRSEVWWSSLFWFDVAQFHAHTNGGSRTKEWELEGESNQGGGGVIWSFIDLFDAGYLVKRPTRDFGVAFYIGILVVVEWKITLIPLQLIRPRETFLFLVAQILGRREMAAGERCNNWGPYAEAPRC